MRKYLKKIGKKIMTKLWEYGILMKKIKERI
jgi:hypothetical protein